MEPTNPLLPALRPDTPGLIRRAGNLIGAVHGIQQEANAEYWYECGVNYKKSENWHLASSCLRNANAINNSYWQALLLESFVCAKKKDVQKSIERLVDADVAKLIAEDIEFTSILSVDDWGFLMTFLVNAYESMAVKMPDDMYCGGNVVCFLLKTNETDSIINLLHALVAVSLYAPIQSRFYEEKEFNQRRLERIKISHIIYDFGRHVCDVMSDGYKVCVDYDKYCARHDDWFVLALNRLSSKGRLTVYWGSRTQGFNVLKLIDIYKLINSFAKSVGAFWEGILKLNDDDGQRGKSGYFCYRRTKYIKAKKEFDAALENNSMVISNGRFNSLRGFSKLEGASFPKEIIQGLSCFLCHAFPENLRNKILFFSAHEAVADLERALLLDATDGFTIVTLARVYHYYLADYEKAKSLYDIALDNKLELKGHGYGLLFLRGLVNFAKRDYNSALADFDAYGYGHWECAFRTGDVYAAKGEIRLATKFYEQAIQELKETRFDSGEMVKRIIKRLKIVESPENRKSVHFDDSESLTLFNLTDSLPDYYWSF